MTEKLLLTEDGHEITGRCTVRTEMRAGAEIAVQIIAYPDHDPRRFTNGMWMEMAFSGAGGEEMGARLYGECRRCGALVRVQEEEEPND